jgi:hypothetical protein
MLKVQDVILYELPERRVSKRTVPGISHRSTRESAAWSQSGGAPIGCRDDEPIARSRLVMTGATEWPTPSSSQSFYGCNIVDFELMSVKDFSG